MRVAFRVDSALHVGSGHVMRCLAMADGLSERGDRCVFVCRDFPGNRMDIVRARGFDVLALPALAAGDRAREAGAAGGGWLRVPWDVDARETLDAVGAAGVEWLVVDHYGIDARWERALRTQARRILVIDDLADRPHDADVLLDQNPGRKGGDYAGLVPAGCRLLLGPRYALLRPGFAAQRRDSLARRAEGRCDSIVVCMGSMDTENATAQVLDALAASGASSRAKVTVVLGAQAPWLEAVRAQARRMGPSCEVLVDVPDMAALLAGSDLAIGAMGTSALERCALGVPTLGIVLAENQQRGAEALSRAGAVSLLPAGEDIRTSLRHVLSQHPGREALLRMSAAAASVCDGLGVPRTVEDAFTGPAGGASAVRVRRMAERDLEDVLAWRNHPEVRMHMRTRHEIPLEEHRAWFARCETDGNRALLVIEDGAQPLGFVQFTRVAPGEAEWGFYLRPGAPAGSGRKLGAAALDFAFGELELSAVHGKVFQENARSLAFHARLGFMEARNADGDGVRSFRIGPDDWRKRR